jgi:hypothetical protein
LVQLRTYYRSGAGSNPNIALVRQRIPTDAGNNLVFQFLVDDTDTRQVSSNNIPAALSTVRNDLYAYAFTFCMGAGDSFLSARLMYRYSSAGD